jgi:hypothetical protein
MVHIDIKHTGTWWAGKSTTPTAKAEGVEYAYVWYSFSPELQHFFRFVVENADGIWMSNWCPFWFLNQTKTWDGPPWRLRSHNTLFAASALTLTTVSDIFNHMWLAYSYLDPWHRRYTHKKRGTVLWHEGGRGLVSPHLVEQAQSDDTLEHTFTVPVPAWCNRVWWYYYAYVDGRLSRSRTPFFTWERTTAPSDPMVWTTYYNFTSVNLYHYRMVSFGLRPTLGFVANKISWWAIAGTSLPYPATVNAAIWSAGLTYNPLVNLSGEYSTPVSCPGPGVPVLVSVDIPDTPMTALSHYALALCGPYTAPRVPIQRWGIRRGTGGQGVPININSSWTRTYLIGTGWSAWSAYALWPAYLTISGYVP